MIVVEWLRIDEWDDGEDDADEEDDEEVRRKTWAAMRTVNYYSNHWFVSRARCRHTFPSVYDPPPPPRPSRCVDPRDALAKLMKKAQGKSFDERWELFWTACLCPISLPQQFRSMTIGVGHVSRSRDQS